jgi:predicted component of type VI protein secretion system
VIAGPDSGKSRRLRGVRTVVGRAQDCDFRVADGSVSRRHLEVVVSDECVLLRDLGSGNGTRVNGQRVDERVLRDQDEIAIGRTRFRFVDELGPARRARRTMATPPSPSPSPSPSQARPAPPPSKRVLSAARAPAARSRDRRTRLAIVAAAVLIASGAGIGFAVRAVRTARLEKVNPPMRAEPRPDPAPAPAAAPVPPAPAPDQSARAVPDVPAVQPAPAPSAAPPARAAAKAEPNPQKKPAASAKRRKE